jgi:hypothetical protein
MGRLTEPGGAMTHIVVLFNLKAGASAADYEAWAKATDMANVRALKTVASFDVLKTLSVRGSDAAPPYQYIELIHIPDMQAFGTEVANDRMKEVARQFREFADNPTFIVCESLEA